MCCVGCVSCVLFMMFFFFKQKTAYEMRISDWSSDVCSSDLEGEFGVYPEACERTHGHDHTLGHTCGPGRINLDERRISADRSEEHTSELQSLMRISYAVFCLKKKKTTKYSTPAHNKMLYNQLTL